MRTLIAGSSARLAGDAPDERPETERPGRRDHLREPDRVGDTEAMQIGPSPRSALVAGNVAADVMARAHRHSPGVSSIHLATFEGLVRARADRPGS